MDRAKLKIDGRLILTAYQDSNINDTLL